MNTIKVSEKNWEDLATHLDGYHIAPRSCFVFDEFELVFCNKKLFKVCLEDGTYAFKVFLHPLADKVYMSFSYEALRDAWRRDYEIMDKSLDPDMVYEYLERNGEHIINMVLGLIEYVMSYQRDHKEAHPVPRKYSREHKISASNNKVYLLDDVVKYIHDNYVPQGGTHNIQCECWGVRGHYRTYKSGKQVWINAYKKGKKRQEMEPKDKTYYISKGETI